MALTEKDLQNLEQKVKYDISKEQAELRHGDRSKLQGYYNMVDDLKTDSALTKQSMETMTEKIDAISLELKEMKADIRSGFEKLDNKFAGKWTENALIFVGSAFGLAIIGAVTSLILIK